MKCIGYGRKYTLEHEDYLLVKAELIEHDKKQGTVYSQLVRKNQS